MRCVCTQCRPWRPCVAFTYFSWLPRLSLSPAAWSTLRHALVLLTRPRLFPCDCPTENAPAVLIRPHTGRRHQLRLHALHMGHPILGDTTYGDADHTVPRMCLHAQSLRLRLAPPERTAAAAAVPASEAAATAAAEEGTAVAGAEGGLTRGQRYRGRQEVQPVGGGEGLGGEVLEAVAPDPFVFADGELQL